MKTHELDYQAALAMGVNPDRNMMENEQATGLAFKHFPARGSYYAYFRIVTPAGISTVWSPTTRWSDCAELIRRMVAAAPMTLAHDGTRTVCLQYEGQDADEDPRIAIVRRFINTRTVAAPAELEACEA